MRRPVTEVAAFVDKYGKCLTGSSRLNELLYPGHIFGNAVRAPEHHRQLARLRQNLGSTVGGLVLKLCRDQYFFAALVTDHQVGAACAPRSG